MSPNDPYALWLQAAVLLRQAARLAADPGVLWPVRGRAAALCCVLASQVAEDEALCADVMRAAHACVETFPVVHDLLVAALEVAPDPSLLVVPMRRLCRDAHASGHHDTVVVTLVTALDIDSFDGAIPSAWFVAACAVTGEADYWLRRLVRSWAERFGANHEGIRAVVRDRADQWFPAHRFCIDVLRSLHAAEPTAAGWIALASRRGEMASGGLGLSFGDRHADAVVALREALLRAVPAAAHAALEGWLTELSQ
ncbi:MAG TPA: hypothetical protein VNW92_16100 [Polyangiaceae bacterium]|nr:hypothetical protein [Polyangiaceae bacterium]